MPISDEKLATIARSAFVGFLAQLNTEIAVDEMSVHDSGPHRVFVVQSVLSRELVETYELEEGILLEALTAYLALHNACPLSVKLHPYAVFLYENTRNYEELIAYVALYHTA